jgi:hypothetical protein
MKKIVLIVNIILFALVCVFLIVKVENNQNIYCEVGNEEDFQKIEENTTLTNENILQKLIFNGEALPYDTETSTFYLPLSMKNENWEFGKLLSGDEDVSILFKDDLQKTGKLDSIASNQRFEFIAFTNSKYRTYNLVFTGLPIMNISVNEGNLADSAQVDMSLYSANTKSEWVEHSMANMNVRGFTSRQYPKQAYKMELTKFDKSGNTVNNDMSLLNMRKDNDWILYAMYSDETKVRDKLSIDIWNEFGAKDNPFSCNFGTKLEYVELVIDGEYHGIYGLMEPVDAKKLDITKSNDPSGQEYIYKKTDPRIPLTLDEFKEDSDVTTRDGFELKGTSKYGQISLQTWEPLMKYIAVQNIEDNKEYSKKIQETIDINSASNLWLFFQITSSTDSRGKNVYYVPKMTNNGKRLFFVPWDLDLTWGNVSKDTARLYIAYENEMIQELVNWEPGQRIIDNNVDNCVPLVKEKWNTLRGTILTNEALTSRIEDLENTVINSGAMAREEARWPDGGHTYDFSTIKKYATDKMDYLDTFFANLGEE